MLGAFQVPGGSGALDQAAKRCPQLGVRLCVCRGVEDAREARPHSSRHDCQVPQVLWSFDGVHQSYDARKQSCGRQEVATTTYMCTKNPTMVIQPGQLQHGLIST